MSAWGLCVFLAAGCVGGGETDSASPTGVASLGAESSGSESDSTTTASSSSPGVTSAISTSGPDSAESNPTIDPPETDGDCPGCINAAGICQAGEFDTACGRGGSECVACEAPEVCAEGVCESPPTCGPDNCEGCCDGDDCVPTPSRSACGAGGDECTECNREAECIEGACELPCEDTCFGCCTADGTCIDDGDANDDACGLFGTECLECGGDEVCDFGTCSSPSCIETCDGCCIGGTCFGGFGTEACGFEETCDVCSDGYTCDSIDCVVNPNVQWSVTLLDGDIAPLNPDGDAWDAFGGAPDPYLEVVELDFTSANVANTLSPAWNETISTAELTTDLWQDLTFIMRDSDSIVDDLIGECTVQLPDEAFGALHEVECEVDGDFRWSALLSIQVVQK